MSVSTVGEIVRIFKPTESVSMVEHPVDGVPQEITVYTYDNGGSINYLNRTIHKVAKERSFKDEDAFIAGVNQYLDDQLATTVVFGDNKFNELISRITPEESFKSRYISSLIVRSYSNTFKFKSISGEMITLGLNAENNEKATDYIIKAVEEDKIKERLGLSGVIDFVISSDFSYSKVAVRVANQVQKMINNLDNIEVAVNSEDSTLFALVKTEEKGQFYYKVHQDYSQTKGLKIDVRALPGDLDTSIEIPQWKEFFSTPPPGITGISEAVVQFPDVFESEEAKNVLRNDSSLKDKDIRTYDFLNFKEQPATVYGEFFDWSRDSKAPDELIEIRLKNKYAEFILAVMRDYRDDEQLKNTIGGIYVQRGMFDNVFNKQIYHSIAVDKEVNRRLLEFAKLAELSRNLDLDKGEELSPEDLIEAEVAGAKGFIASVVDDPPPINSENLENRQKFFKQCALMLNMPTLRNTYQEKLNEQYSGTVPYHGRFTTLRSPSGNQESMLSSLVSSAQEQKLFELEGHKISRLVPKIRLFKVFTIGGKEKEVEFIFDRTSHIDRPAGPRKTSATKFMDIDFDKGAGVGLKNFSFEFNGTNPAEARNDITASLSLFFQSFSDFTRFRKGRGEKDEYRFVDLVIQPTPDEQGKVNGIDVQSDRQYEPQFYRIRAEVGYVVPTDIDETGINGFTSAERDAIRISNKSFFLNMVDHDISFGKDGSVEIKISYRAYLESLLKHPRLDALASPELINKRIQNAQTLTTQLNNKKCSVEQIKELQTSLAGQEVVLIKKSLSSIITRLKDRKVIYNIKINKNHKQDFINKGYFVECDLETGVEDGSDGVDVKLVLSSDLPESSKDFDFMDSANRSIQFFYFGDLLYTILDCVYANGGTYRPGTGFERSSIVLGSFEFEPFQTVNIADNVYNIADIPISVDFFSRWFVDNVVSQKSTRKTFPVMNFIRSLSNHLIKPALIENCVNRKLETRLRFQTTQITADSAKGVNPLEGTYTLNPGGRSSVSMDVSNLRTAGIIPFRGGPINDADSNYKNFHTFIVLNALGSTLSYSGNGSYKEDINNGKFHVHVGQNAGLVKTLSLSKSDQQYIREARFFQNGIDGLLQLSAVYVANIEMFGNTLFYPGMEIFFNPYGIGGPSFDPRKKNSMANKLGIGGYHTITSVKSSISPGKFTTSISAQQYYSGDGTGNPNIVKKRNAAKKATSIESYVPANPGSKEDYEVCKNVILNAQNYKYTTESAAPPIEESRVEDTEELPFATEPLSDPFGTSDNEFEATSGELGESIDE